MDGESGARPPRQSPGDRYLVKSVVNSTRVLSAFHTRDEALALRDVALRAGLPKSMTFRLLYTLTHCGLIEKIGRNLYRSVFAAQSTSVA